MSLLGMHGMIVDDDAPHGGAVQDVALSRPAGPLGGGTDEIQRNVVGERGPGLPREPQVDKDVPFGDPRTGTTRDGETGDG